MKRVVSISGGKSSAYILANYPSDYAVFSLVRTNEKRCLYPDSGIRKIVSDKIGMEFIGTLEMDKTIKIVLELEQFTGKKIDWITGITFEEVIDTKGGFLPSYLRRFCTTNLKMIPIMDYWYNKFNREIVEMAIGFRANEQKRANRLIMKCDKDGIQADKFIVGKRKTQNKWGLLKWRRPVFPLISINNPINKMDIDNYWNKNKAVPFSKDYINNCVGCFHRNPILLKKMWNTHKNKMEFFSDQEKKNKGTFREDMTYERIKNWRTQIELSFDDFSECDSGYCGL